MDLHFLNTPSTATPVPWFNRFFDCFFANRTPDWGIAGQEIDNPRLVTDMHNAGTETTVASRLQSGTYTVGVHYYCDRQYGSSDALVRIFCGGALVASIGPTTVPKSNTLWEVAEIQFAFPACRVTPLNVVRDVTQGCEGF